MPTRFLLVFCVLMLGVLQPARAALDPALLRGLAHEAFAERLAAIEALGMSGGEAPRRILAALEAGELAVRPASVAGDAPILLILGADGPRLAETGAAFTDPGAHAEPLRLNNRLRRALTVALAAQALDAPEAATRLAAALTLRDNASEKWLPRFEAALERETDPKVADVLRLAAARLQLASPETARRLAAVRALGASSDPAVLNLLDELAGSERNPELQAAIAQSRRAIDQRIATAQAVGTVFSGLSLGSILLLAALGLAITYGVMGIINMAHGELLMVGAYATFVVQGLFRAYLPAQLDYYVLAAVPVAFLAAALVGVLMERLVLRHLYGRPLESLLATWGLSLILIQAARVTFGPQNLELANPGWMSGGIELAAGVVLPWNRIAIIVFAGFVLLLIWLMMQKTRLGMFVRAVTQNRPMAGCVGVPTARVDTLAFAIGSGVAGLGGLALSQIANVGPAMGTGYIVDAFMVVVLGGVGQLAGAVWAALGLGIVSKFLEGWAGAVIAKILVLVFIIVFIQKRPQGLFALKGRFADG